MKTTFFIVLKNYNNNNIVVLRNKFTFAPKSSFLFRR